MVFVVAWSGHWKVSEQAWTFGGVPDCSGAGTRAATHPLTPMWGSVQTAGSRKAVMAV
jgi:hypothetical protein